MGDETRNNHEENRRTMYELLHPTQNSVPSCIMFPPNAPHVELKQGLLAILPEFRGQENENPYVHVRAFEEVISSFYAQNVIETAKLRFFPFSLKDKARSWLYTLKPRSIDWRLVSYFYEGLTPRDRQFVQLSCGGDFLQKEPEDAMDYLDEIAENSNTWTGPCPMDSTDRTRTNTTTSSGSVFKLREDDNMSAKISMLTKEIEALKMKGSRSVSATFREDPMEVCKICHEINHSTNECASLSSFLNVPEEQVHAFNSYWPNNSSYSNNYNPNMRNHPYLSYKSDNVLNPPAPRNSNSPHASSSSRTSLEDALSTFIQRQSEQNQKFESMLTRLDEEVRETKSHITRLTNSLSGIERGKLPSQTQPNPINQNLKIGSKDKHEEVKAVTILRSGKEIDKSSPLVTKKSKETPVEKEKDETESLEFGEIEQCPIPPPFPQALKLPRKLDTASEILEHLHQVKINLSLLHVIKQVPAYAKVIKDLCTIKRKHHVKKTAFLTEQVSAVIQHKTPPKYKDLGCPTISCTIGDYIMEHALLDLGASVNLIPFSVYQKLGLGELKPTSITLQLADRSVREPRGIVEDVLVKIEQFYYPVDFIVLDYQPILHPSVHTPIILCRPFLATTNALINCRNGRMQLTFGSMTLELNIFHVAKQPHEDDDCAYVNLIEAVVQEEFNKNCFSDPLETLLNNSVGSYDLECDIHVSENFSLLNSSQVLEEQQMIAVNEGWKPCFKELPEKEKKHVHSSEKVPQLELKPLPNGLKYAYLGPGKLKPRWDGPFIVRKVFNHETVVVEDPKDGRILKVNEQRVKPFLGGVIPEEKSMSLEIPAYWDAM
nr:uncharacterized protein LOC112030337 [Quercus suber]